MSNFMSIVLCVVAFVCGAGVGINLHSYILGRKQTHKTIRAMRNKQGLVVMTKGQGIIMLLGKGKEPELEDSGFGTIEVSIIKDARNDSSLTLLSREARIGMTVKMSDIKAVVKSMDHIQGIE